MPGPAEETSKGPESQAPTKETAPATPVEPITAKDWNEHEKNVKTHLAKIDPKVVEEAINAFKTELKKLNNLYDDALRAAHGEAQATDAHRLEAANTKELKEGVNTLIEKIKKHEHYKEGAKTDGQTAAPQGAPDATDKGKEKLVRLTTGPNGQLETAMKILGKQYESLKNPVVAKIVQEQVSKMDFSANQLAQIERGVEKSALGLSAKQVEEIKGAMPEQIGEYDSEEGNLLESFFESQKGKDTDAKKNDGMSAIEELFADDNDPMRVYLSRMYKITKNEKGELTIEDPNGKNGLKDKNGKPQPETITKADQLEKYLPEGESEKIFKALAAGKDIEKNVKNFTEDAEKQLKGLDDMKELQGSLLSQETLDKAEAMGPLGGLAMLIKLFVAIKKAFDTNDWDTLGDFMNDWNESKDPKQLTEKLEKSKKEYERAMEDPKPPPDIKQTLEAYLNPRGKEANELFQNSFEKGLTTAEIAAHPLNRYRTEAKPHILNYMIRVLGVKAITDKDIDKNTKEITVTKMDNKKVAIEFNFSDGKTKARVVPYEKKTGEDGKETLVKAEDNIGDFQEVTFAELGKMLGKKPADAAGANPAEKPEEILVKRDRLLLMV